ncbi:tyrosine-type recombinase/integrase [Variovorax sp. Root318D1]|uniref:tyrosine-type recombinase/integrase n=1 Tax=Variovorax sp. Root318D1 TaxID=1736513 RepID=UPI0026AF5386
MSENTINAALRGMGYSAEVHTAHGFRATARTIMDEVLGERVDFIEHQLSHTVKDANGRAYNRTAHLPARREMMQRWADYLDKLRIAGLVVSGLYGAPGFAHWLRSLSKKRFNREGSEEADVQPQRDVAQ